MLSVKLKTTVHAMLYKCIFFLYIAKNTIDVITLYIKSLTTNFAAAMFNTMLPNFAEL